MNFPALEVGAPRPPCDVTDRLARIFRNQRMDTIILSSLDFVSVMNLCRFLTIMCLI